MKCAEELMEKVDILLRNKQEEVSIVGYCSLCTQCLEFWRLSWDHEGEQSRVSVLDNNVGMLLEPLSSRLPDVKDKTFLCCLNVFKFYFFFLILGAKIILLNEENHGPELYSVTQPTIFISFCASAGMFGARNIIAPGTQDGYGLSLTKPMAQ